jgi:hypothetical protein
VCLNQKLRRKGFVNAMCDILYVIKVHGINYMYRAAIEEPKLLRVLLFLGTAPPERRNSMPENAVTV